jgi:hypothetical protein
MKRPLLRSRGQLSRSSHSNTMAGFLPPSSTELDHPATRTALIRAPTVVEPVKRCH